MTGWLLNVNDTEAALRRVWKESMNRRASCRGLSDNSGSVFAPCKMIAPSLLARMKQGSKEAGFWINALQFVVLVVVAGPAGEGQIVQICRAIPTFRNNMFRRKRVYRMVFTTAAELTLMTRSFCHCLFETPGNGSSSHAAPDLIHASACQDQSVAYPPAQTRL